MPVYDQTEDCYIMSAEEILSILIMNTSPSQVVTVLLPRADKADLERVLVDGFADMLEDATPGLDITGATIDFHITTTPDGEVIARVRLDDAGLC